MKSELNVKIKNKINIFLSNYFNLLLFIIIISLLASGYTLIVKPKYENLIKEISVAGQERNLEYSERSKYLNKLKELKAEYDKVSANDIDRAYMLAPKEEYYEKMFAEIEDLVLKKGFLLSSLSIEKAESKDKKEVNNENVITENSEENNYDGVKTLSIKMDILGVDYNNLKKLLGILENNLRLLDVYNLAFSPENNSVSITMSAYYVD